ncbi:hypothetical protein ACEWY4_019845 [Coilia grayii]|uniref:C2H2-type domain-containing protein n=1 Tax=Coilia grayii TaxID=363190 RepID=A0ABD1JB81_9TELE
MEDPFLDYCSSQELSGEADAFICTECGEGFVQYSKLVSHMAIHGPSDSFPTDTTHVSNGLEAPIVFALHNNGTLTVLEKLEASDSHNTKLNQFDHQSQSTSVKGSSENSTKLCLCERCGQAFSNQLSLQQHQQCHSMGQEYKCTLCCKVHEDRESLREHLQDHAHERFYSCGHCGKRFLKRETLSVHQKEWHSSLLARNYNRSAKSQEIGKFYECKLCDLHFFWLSDLQSHLISHSLKKIVPTDNLESVIKENVPHSYGADRLYRCGLCGKSFHVLSDLKQHHLSHQTADENSETLGSRATEKSIPNVRGSRPFTPKQYHRLDAPRSRRMRGRRGSHHGNARLYPCKHCHRVFVHSSSLSRHNRYHKGTLHTCVYCGRHFPQRCDVTRHIAQYHQSELNGTADGNSMDEESTETNTLVKQAKNDLENAQGGSGTASSNERSSTPKARLSFKCRDCGKVFGLLSVYQRHQRYHKKEPHRQLHKCSQCRCRFSQLSALERHLKTHKDSSSEVGKEGSPTADTSKDDNVDSEDTDETVDDANGEGDESVKAELLYECTVCGQSYSSMKMFMKHQREHG